MLCEDWNYPLEERAGYLKARVGVDFNQVRLELRVDHKIHSKELKVIIFTLRVEE